MKIPIYECKIDENVNDITGVYALSFVDEPANEEQFIALSNNVQLLKIHLSRY